MNIRVTDTAVQDLYLNVLCAEFTPFDLEGGKWAVGVLGGVSIDGRHGKDLLVIAAQRQWRERGEWRNEKKYGTADTGEPTTTSADPLI